MFSRRERRWLVLVAVVAVVLAAQPAFAQGEKAKPEARQVEKKAMPAMDPMMQKMMELGRPGPNHEVLKPMVGVWDAKATFWMAPGAPPSQSSGLMTNTMTLDGRFVRQEYKSSDMMGMSFQGLGYFGYDNIKKQYVGTWMDSMGTGIMVSYGTYDPATKTFTSFGEYQDPTANGATVKEKQVAKIIDKDHMTYEMYRLQPDGKEMKEGEITYARRAGGMGKPMVAHPRTK